MIIRKEGNLIIVKIFKEHAKIFDIYDTEEVVLMFKSFFNKIKKKYDINGLCVADVYVNEAFGMIIEINNFYSFDDEIDVKVSFHIDSIFLMEIMDIDDSNEVYFYNNKLYALYDNKKDGKAIYKDSLMILNEGIKIK